MYFFSRFLSMDFSFHFHLFSEFAVQSNCNFNWIANGVCARCVWNVICALVRLLMRRLIGGVRKMDALIEISNVLLLFVHMLFCFSIPWKAKTQKPVYSSIFTQNEPEENKISKWVSDHTRKLQLCGKPNHFSSPFPVPISSLMQFNENIEEENDSCRCEKHATHLRNSQHRILLRILALPSPIDRKGPNTKSLH